MYRHPSYQNKNDCQDRFAVHAPGLNDSCWVNNAFNLYAMEIEAQRERANAIEKFISFLANTDDPNNIQNQWDAAAYSGICDFSPAEQEYVENEVAHRCQIIST